MELTQDRLRELLDYDPETGVFTWRVERSGKGRNGIRAGQRAGWIDTSEGQGYRFIEIDRRKHKAAKLAWLYMTGAWPSFTLDHRDRDRANDRFDNLRPCSKPQNGANMSLRRDNSSGVRGVNWNRNERKWHARVMWQHRSYHLGFFDTLEEAKAAREAKAEALFGEFNPGL